MLSSQIQELRDGARGSGVARARPLWRRLVLPLAGLLVAVVVVGLGLLLFNRPLIEQLVPPPDLARAEAFELAPQWEPEWVSIPSGSFYGGPPFIVPDEDLDAGRPDDPDEYIRRYSITNERYLEFLLAQEDVLRAAGRWSRVFPKLASGWRYDADDRPAMPRATISRRPLRRDLLDSRQGKYLTLDAIRLYRAWVVTQPSHHVQGLSITNGLWREFLDSEVSALQDSGEWELVVPNDSSGWGLDVDGFPTPPLYEVTEHDEETDTERTVLVSDDTTLVAGVGLRAVELFHDWFWRRRLGYAFSISKYEVRNELWRDFLEAEEPTLRAAGLWSEAVPGRDGNWVQDEDDRWVPPATELDRPVTNISLRAARAFTRWLTERLGQKSWQIDVPTPDEWTYAARGDTWQIYPWGERFLGAPRPKTGAAKARGGIESNEPMTVDHVEEDASPFGVIGMGTNVCEWTADQYRSQLRGASFADPVGRARDYARVWDSRPFDAKTVFNDAGIRLVKRPAQTD